MPSIPFNDINGNVVGLKVVPANDDSGDVFPVVHIDNIDLAQGPQGEPGPQGPTGPAGPQGAPGERTPYLVRKHTTDYQLLSTDVGRVFSNGGATDLVGFLLPVPTIGLHYYFVVEAPTGTGGFGDDGFGEFDYGDTIPGGVVVTADPTSTISFGDAFPITTDSLSSSVRYSAIHLVGTSTTKWIALSVTGTWDASPAPFGSGGFGLGDYE